MMSSHACHDFLLEMILKILHIVSQTTERVTMTSYFIQSLTGGIKSFEQVIPEASSHALIDFDPIKKLFFVAILKHFSSLFLLINVPKIAQSDFVPSHDQHLPESESLFGLKNSTVRGFRW